MATKYPIEEHGTVKSYTYGCRCSDCKKAIAFYKYESNKKYIKKSEATILAESIASEPAYRFVGGKKR